MDLKINIELSLSKETIELVENVLNRVSSCQCVNRVPADEEKKDPEPEPEPAPAPAKPARQRTRKAAPAAEASAAENKEQETAGQPADTTSAAEAPAAKDPQQEETQSQEEGVKITLEDVRKAVTAKQNEHRDELINKLHELKAASIPSLDPSKYKEFIDYCNSLK